MLLTVSGDVLREFREIPVEMRPEGGVVSLGLMQSHARLAVRAKLEVRTELKAQWAQVKIGARALMNEFKADLANTNGFVAATVVYLDSVLDPLLAVVEPQDVGDFLVMDMPSTVALGGALLLFGLTFAAVAVAAN